MNVRILVVSAAFACGNAAPLVHEPRYVPQEAPEDQPGAASSAPPPVSAELSTMDRAIADVHQRIDAQPTSDGGAGTSMSQCLWDIASQMSAARRSAADREDSRRAATARGDADLANHEHEIVVTLGERVRDLSNKASACR